MNQSVRKAFDVLTYIIENPGKHSLKEMAAALDMNKTTLFRFLSTLESLDILTRWNDAYVPGIKLFEWGGKVPVKQILVDKVHPLLRHLTAEVNETVNMGQFSNNQVIYLDKTESERSLQIRTRVGGAISIHTSALGKSILSILPESMRDSVIRNLSFERKTPLTITDPAVLLKQVELVRQRGYSTDCEELEEGLHCVAVPLSIPSLSFYGAISCSGPSVRFTPQRMAQLASNLNRTVADIRALFESGEHL